MAWPVRPVLAFELGDLTVDSHVGEILAARIEVFGEIEALSTVEIAAPEIFIKEHVGWRPFHERLVIEPVMSAYPPYLSLSSIGFIKRQHFGLVIAVTQNNQATYTTYRVTLKPRVSLSGSASPEESLSAPEVLSVLVAQLGSNGKVPAVSVFTELVRVGDGRDSGGGIKMPVLRIEDEPETAFINGLLALMTPAERQRFDSLRARQSTTKDVVLALLFDPPGSLLKRLLWKGRHTRELLPREGQETHLKQMRENNLALQNEVLALRSQLEVLRDQRLPVQGTSADTDANSADFDFRFFQENWEILLTKRPWQVLAVVTFVLMLITLWQWWRIRQRSHRMASRKTPDLW